MSVSKSYIVKNNSNSVTLILTNQPTNQTTNQPTNQPTKPTNQTTNQPTNQTNPVEQSPSGEIYKFSASQEIPCSLCNLKAHYHADSSATCSFHQPL